MLRNTIDRPSDTKFDDLDATDHKSQNAAWFLGQLQW